MISIDMSSQYVDYYKKLCASDEICVIGFGFNSDDEHINGLFRDLIDRQGKSLTYVTIDDGIDPVQKKKELMNKMKIHSDDRITIISVDGNRCKNGLNWIDCLISAHEA